MNKKKTKTKLQYFIINQFSLIYVKYFRFMTFIEMSREINRQSRA